MKLREFFQEISGLNYVVQRNWENLPDSYITEGHYDLDLFATDQAKVEIKEILKKYPEIFCDIRVISDNYYPEEISRMLLQDRMGSGGVWIPNQKAAFFALYYHNLVHKQNNPYKEKLDKMFSQIYFPVKCKDQGVGFYYDNN